MSRYLITGATTTVAYALIEQLLAKPDTKRVLAVGKESLRSSRIRDGRLRYIRSDLARERSLRRLVFGPVRDEGITHIIHMATHRASVEGKRAHALNVGAARGILHFAERVESVQRFVYRSYGSVYKTSADMPVRIDEEHPLRIGPRTPQYVLDRVEADLAVCARMGMSRIGIAVLRCTECLAEGAGSQLWDYLQSAVCFRPLGFDPMINVLSPADLGRALLLAAESKAEGIFTIPGKDTLPLSRIIRRFGKREVPIPGPWLRPLYAMRQRTTGADFHYEVNRGWLHFGGVLDGQRAWDVLGYKPEREVSWPLNLEHLRVRDEARNPRSLRGKLTRWLDE
jgi:nucleoside-diphosphate-sugar epimerase